MVIGPVIQSEEAIMRFPTTGGGRLPVIRQAERTECGLACLAMILSYFGCRMDINSLRSRFRISQHGITLKSLVKLAANLHLAARPLRLELADVGQLTLPAILHWDLDHFVILKKVKSRSLVIHNPASGRQEVSLSEAGKHFTGVGLELWPTDGFRKADVRRELPLREIWGNTPGLWNGLLQLLALSALLQLMALGLPFYTQILLDDVLVSGDLDLLKLLAAAFLLLTVFRQMTEWVRGRIVMYLGNRVGFQFATRLCNHLLHLPQEYFARRHLGDVVSRFSSINHVRDFLCSGIVEIAIDGAMAIGALVLMTVYNGLLTVVALAAVLLYGLIRLVTYDALFTRNEEMISDRAVENTCFMENVSAIQGIKLFGRESSRLTGWQNKYADSIHSSVRVQKLGMDIQFFQGMLTGCENILLLLLGAYAVLEGSLTAGMLIAFISFKDHFYRSIFSLVDKIFELRLLKLHLARLADIAFSTPEIGAGQVSLPHRQAKDDCTVTLDRISFTYDEDSKPVFSNVSLQVGAGELVAVIGPTGCGKSTLLKVVASLIPPASGELCYNGHPVTAGNLEAYRSDIAGVMQNDSLLSGNILENITFFDTSPDFDRVESVARQAMIADDIARMPMQYQTMIGSMGAALSGGQVQRLLLARALYKSPRFLVLDEATSHLDVDTEAHINRTLKELGIPCLFVAHRPETVLHADRLFLLAGDGLHQVSHEKFRQLISKKSDNDLITT